MCLLLYILIRITYHIYLYIYHSDIGVFAVTAIVLSVFDSVKLSVKSYISKIKMFQDSLNKHSTPITRKYFFKNVNAADRITLVGVYINVILSVAKFFGGIGKVYMKLYFSILDVYRYVFFCILMNGNV